MSDGSASLYSKIDDAIFAVEKGLTTLAAVIMTVTVTLDILDRALPSLLDGFTGLLSSLVGGAEVSTFVSHSLLFFLVGDCIAAVLIFRSRGNTESVSMASVAFRALLIALAVFCFVYGVVYLPSSWVCAGLAVLGTAFVAVDLVRKKSFAALAVTLVGGGALAWGSTQLPQDYIWSQELSLILLAWLAFLGGSMATRLNKHITVDALARAVPSSVSPWLRAIGLLITTGFCLYVVVLSYHHVFGEFGDFNSGETRPSTGLPAWVITLSVLVSFGLMSFRFAAASVDAFLHPQAPERGLEG